MPGETVLVIDDSPTILRVCQLVLARAGFDVATASDGAQGIEVARERRPAVILLDFLMPRMNGYQVCKALSEEEGLRDIPVVLMSAKGDQVGERFVRVMRIVDYITKPFSPEGLTAVVTHTIAKYRDSTTEENVLLARDPEEIARQAHEEAEARRLALEELRRNFSRLAARAVERGGAERGEPTDADAALRWIETALTDAELEALLAQLRAAAPQLGELGDAVLAGDLRHVPIGQVLWLVGDQKQTGVLTVAQDRTKVDFFFSLGRIAFASASGVSDEFLLGRFIVKAGLMTREELDEFIRSQASASHLLGTQLVRGGQLTAQALRDMLAQQTSELFYEVLRWNYGRFVLSANQELPAVALEANLDLGVDGLLMEGLRRVDEWHLIEKEIDSFDLVFVRDDEAVGRIGRGALSRDELAVLDLINGKNTLRDLVRLTRQGSFEVGKLLYRLAGAHLIRKKVAPLAVDG